MTGWGPFCIGQLPRSDEGDLKEENIKGGMLKETGL